jgi:hypothetical protein
MLSNFLLAITAYLLSYSYQNEAGPLIQVDFVNDLREEELLLTEFGDNLSLGPDLLMLM